MSQSRPTPVVTCIDGKPHLNACPAGKLISNDYFDILTNEIDLWSTFSCQEEYQLVYWCIKHNMSRAASNKLLRNPIMSTFIKFTSSHT
jgi:hypothetical protein